MHLCNFPPPDPFWTRTRLAQTCNCTSHTIAPATLFPDSSLHSPHYHHIRRDGFGRLRNGLGSLQLLPRPFDCYGQEYMPGGWPAEPPTPTANVFARPADPGYFLPGAKKMCRGLAIAAKYTFDTALYTTTTISSSAYTGAVVATSYAVTKPTSRIVRDVNLRRRSRKPSTPTRKLKSTTILSQSPWLRAVAAREASTDPVPTLALPQAPTTSSLLQAAPRLSAATAHAAGPPFKPYIKAPEKTASKTCCYRWSSTHTQHAVPADLLRTDPHPCD